MGRCLIHELINKVNKIFKNYPVEFLLFNTSDPEAMRMSGKKVMEQDKDMGMTSQAGV